MRSREVSWIETSDPWGQHWKMRADKALFFLAKLRESSIWESGQVLTNEQMPDKVWGAEHCGDPHVLQVCRAVLRRELKDNARSPIYTLTKPGIGYIGARQK